MRQEEDEPFIKVVGARIRRLRIERGLSLRECGKLAEVHPFHIMAIELGQLAANTKTLRAIAHALDVTVVDLLNTDNDDLALIVEHMRREPRALETARTYATKRVVN